MVKISAQSIRFISAFITQICILYQRAKTKEQTLKSLQHIRQLTVFTKNVNS